MNQKRFQYQNKDIPFLKKDIRVRIFFMILFGVVFFSQLILLVLNQIDKTITLSMIITSAVIMLLSLMFSIISLVFAFKDMRAIQTISRTGFVVSAVSTLPNLEKRSFVRLYSVLTTLLAIVMLITFTSVITYSILQFVHFATISFYIPLIMLVTIVGFNSAYHVKHEIKTFENVQTFINAF